MTKEVLAKNYVVIVKPASYFSMEEALKAAEIALANNDQVYIYGLEDSLFKEVKTSVHRATVDPKKDPSLQEQEDFRAEDQHARDWREEQEREIAEGIRRDQVRNEPFNPRLHRRQLFPNPPVPEPLQFIHEQMVAPQLGIDRAFVQRIDDVVNRVARDGR